jgi:hypothetical protein
MLPWCSGSFLKRNGVRLCEVLMLREQVGALAAYCLATQMSLLDAP